MRLDQTYKIAWIGYTFVCLLLFVLLFSGRHVAHACTQNVLRGDSGPAVTCVQQFLAQTGDYTYPEVTGYFGSVTEAAVQLFQTRKGIVFSGTPLTTGFGAAGPRTRLALLIDVVSMLRTQLGLISGDDREESAAEESDEDGGLLEGSSGSSCIFDGDTIDSGDSTRAYLFSVAPYGQSCASETRTCTNGTLSGTYAYSSCETRREPQDRVIAEVDMLTGTSADEKLTGLSESFAFDDYFSNPQPGQSDPIDLSVSGRIGQFLRPNSEYLSGLLPGARPFTVESSSGEVRVRDVTSATDPSDIWSQSIGESIVFTVANGSPHSPSASAVDEIAFRLAAVDEGNVSIRVYDRNNEVIHYEELPAGTGYTKALTVYLASSLEGRSSAEIHRVVFINESGDWYLIGSFADMQNKKDVFYSGLETTNRSVEAPREAPEEDASGIPELYVHPLLSENNDIGHGPYLRLQNGDILKYYQNGHYGGNAVARSENGGDTWSSYAQIRPTNLPGRPGGNIDWVQADDGTVVMVYAGANDRVPLSWNNSTRSANADARLNQWIITSSDNGRTWNTPTRLHEGFNGGYSYIFKTREDRLVVLVPDLLTAPDRDHFQIHVYYSDDSGASWEKSGSVIDIEGSGHHAGAMEPVLYQRADGRLVMLIRTAKDYLYQSISSNLGETWSSPRASDFDASSTGPRIFRLEDGTLMLFWNRVRPEYVSETEWNATRSTHTTRRGGAFDTDDGSWNREEVSVAFSHDSGATWTDPQVIIRQKGQWRSWVNVFEIEPGVVWLSTWQDALLKNNVWEWQDVDAEQLRYEFRPEEFWE